jgi:hypothetical protein
MPDPEVCRYCDYQVTCREYWDALETSWGHPSVAGRVLDVRSSPAGSILGIEVESPRDAKGKDWIVSAVPAGLTQPDRFAAISAAEHTESEQQLRWRWSTAIWPRSA